MELGYIDNKSKEIQATSTIKGTSLDNNTPTNMTFEGPVRTLEQLHAALIEKMGPKKGQEMYDNFLQSILISAFGSMHKDMDRAQKASKKMRSTYKD
ncbi:hypothetical protein CP10139811_0770 [Chlamydia ibidis]|uniref:Uncharacterized protein n=2 Tax=Chlamydia ibidis TaxID=1405396 RepID=S7KJT1_9CHLA|nr:hypothetical protein [Chlamydia ibidis]EPP34680.1 hypothetical protein CP10139811_0770 [Chlamydia ibidis]EQM63080.1 hypothetical protein H359_0090 [Chlamydia ibidis 10-1398/6]